MLSDNEVLLKLSYPIAAVKEQIDGYPYPTTSTDWRQLLTELDTARAIAAQACADCEQREKEQSV